MFSFVYSCPRDNNRTLQFQIMNYVPKHFYRLEVKTWENKYRKMCVVSWEELLIVPTWPSFGEDDVLKLEDNKDTVHYIIPTSPFYILMWRRDQFVAVTFENQKYKYVKYIFSIKPLFSLPLLFTSWFLRINVFIWVKHNLK